MSKSIPDFVTAIGILRKKTDRQMEEAYAQFNYLRLNKLENDALKFFFYDLLLCYGYGNTVRVLEFMTRKMRVQKIYEITLFKHELVLHRLNAIDPYKALLYCVWACLHVLENKDMLKDILDNAFKYMRKISYSQYVRKKVISYL